MVKNTSIRHQIFTCDLSELGGAIERCSESTYYKRKSSTAYFKNRMVVMKFATQKRHGAMMYDVSRSQKCNFY